jgi:hypothetical protein
MNEKRKLYPHENKSLELIKGQFLREFMDRSWFNTYQLNVMMYEEMGVDTGEHRRWLKYYKNKLDIYGDN